MSAPTGFSSQGLRGATARDFASLTPLGVDNLDGVKWFYDKAWLIFQGSRTKLVVRIYAETTSPDLVQALLEETKCPRLGGALRWWRAGIPAALLGDEKFFQTV
jgi:predicted alpha-1,6-mannanase (GH76 family)